MALIPLAGALISCVLPSCFFAVEYWKDKDPSLRHSVSSSPHFRFDLGAVWDMVWADGQ